MPATKSNQLSDLITIFQYKQAKVALSHLNLKRRGEEQMKLKDSKRYDWKRIHNHNSFVFKHVFILINDQSPCDDWASSSDARAFFIKSSNLK